MRKNTIKTTLRIATIFITGIVSVTAYVGVCYAMVSSPTTIIDKYISNKESETSYNIVEEYNRMRSLNSEEFSPYVESHTYNSNYESCSIVLDIPKDEKIKDLTNLEKELKYSEVDFSLKEVSQYDRLEIKTARIQHQQELELIRQEQERIRLEQEELARQEQERIRLEQEELARQAELARQEQERIRQQQQQALLANYNDILATRNDRVIAISNEVAPRFGLDPRLIQAITFYESTNNPNAVNGSCVGYMQVSTVWHVNRMNAHGVTNLYDPYGNIVIACSYLKDLISNNNGNLALALMIYNGDSRAHSLNNSGQMSTYANNVITLYNRLVQYENILNGNF